MNRANVLAYMLCALSVGNAAYGAGTGRADIRVIPEPRETYVAGEPIAVGDGKVLNVEFNYHSDSIPELLDAEIRKRLFTTFGARPASDQPILTIDFYSGWMS